MRTGGPWFFSSKRPSASLRVVLPMPMAPNAAQRTPGIGLPSGSFTVPVMVMPVPSLNSHVTRLLPTLTSSGPCSIDAMPAAPDMARPMAPANTVVPCSGWLRNSIWSSPGRAMNVVSPRLSVVPLAKVMPSSMPMPFSVNMAVRWAPSTGRVSAANTSRAVTSTPLTSSKRSSPPPVVLVSRVG